jgi:Leucine-rich repeat (LRR) protein
VESQGLVSVALKNRRLSEIPERLMRGGDRIHDLDLRRNRLQPPALDCLAFFTNLVSVHLAHNGLAELPLSICSLPNLERLFLNDNNLSSLPDEIGKLVKLKVLRICQNQLTALPDTIGECAQLESLVAGSIHGT